MTDYRFVLPSLAPYILQARFCLWLNTVPPGRTEPTKVPFGVGGLPALSNNHTTWLTYPDAISLWANTGSPTGKDGGIGIFLGYGLAGIDLDTCIGPEGLAGWALPLIDLLGPGLEFSPSGTGLKAFLRYDHEDAAAAEAVRTVLGFGVKPNGTPQWGGELWKAKTDQKHPPGIEGYMASRFFAMTGEPFDPGQGALPLHTLDVARAQAIQRVAESLGGRSTPARSAAVAGSRPVYTPDDCTEDEAYRRVLAGRANLPQLDALLRGGANQAPAAGVDDSRSGRAFRLIRELKRCGLSRSNVIGFLMNQVDEAAAAAVGQELLIQDPAIRDWIDSKGLASGAREIIRAYEHVPPGSEGMPPVAAEDRGESDAGETDPAATAATGAGQGGGGSGRGNGAGPAGPLPPANWQTQLMVDGRGICGTISNALIIFANDPLLQGLLVYDNFQHSPVLTGPLPPAAGEEPKPGPYPRDWTEDDVTLANAYLQRLYNSRFARTTTYEALSATASNIQINPVVDWLDSLQWNGTPILDSWLTHAFGVPDDPYHREVGAKFLVGAVRRAKKPGCKFDYVPVLEGPQGLGKSRACAKLFGEQWFSDNLPGNLEDKDASAFMSGIWGIEMAEFEHLVRTSNETVKAFLTRQVDRYRPAYGKITQKHPRQCVMVATTNQDDWARDATGNRRYWPIKCEKADVAWIEANREQLWAEAVAREATGWGVWLGVDVEETAREHQSERMMTDLWTPQVAVWLQDRKITTTIEILGMAIGLSKDRMTRREEMRVGFILRSLSWQPFRWKLSAGKDKKSMRSWHAPTIDEKEAVETARGKHGLPPMGQIVPFPGAVSPGPFASPPKG